MRSIVAIAAAVGLAFGPVAQGASDPGLIIPQGQAGAVQRAGAGVQVSYRVPLGGERMRSVEGGPTLSLRAGPSLGRGATAARAASVHVAPMAEFALRPGHSRTFSLAGTPVAQNLSPAALREADARAPNGERKGISTLGGIGIGVAVLVVVAGVGLLIFIDKVNDASD